MTSGCSNYARCRDQSRPSPRHPARHAIRGGWQVSWLAGPGVLPPSRFARQRTYESVASGQTLTAYSCGGSRGFVPHSLFALSLERGHRRNQYTVAAACCQRHSTCLTLPPVVRCSTARYAHRVKREAGASAAGNVLPRGTLFRHCPRNGKRASRRIYPSHCVCNVGRRFVDTAECSACVRKSGDRPDTTSGYLRGGRTRRS
jgi:hypothetical protein